MNEMTFEDSVERVEAEGETGAPVVVSEETAEDIKVLFVDLVTGP